MLHSNGRINITRLPPEILILILSYLPATSLLAFSLTSHLFYQVVKGTSFLQYTLEKHKAGLEEAYVPTHPGITWKRKLLNEREQAWRNFQYKFATRLAFNWPKNDLYHIARSVLFTGYVNRQGLASSILYSPLPTHDQQQANWRRIDVGNSIIDIGTALEFDLIALVCQKYSAGAHFEGIEILLRSFSTGAVYPYARRSTIPVCKLPNHCSHPISSVQICGENLVLSVDFEEFNMSPDVGVFYVYDWRTGSVKFKPKPTFSPGIAFLRTDVMIKTYLNRKNFQVTLEAYYIPSSSSTLCGNDKTLKPFKLLNLPRVNKDMEIPTITCRSDPNPRDPLIKFPATRSERPFTNRSEDALIIFNFEVLDVQAGLEQRHFAFVLHRDRLLSLIQPALSRLLKSSNAGIFGRISSLDKYDMVPVPWSRWGPQITRWFPYGDDISENITATNGGRFINLTCFADGELNRLEVMDFGRGKVREAYIQKQLDRSGREWNESHTGRWKVVTEPERLENSNMNAMNGRKNAFCEDVVSYLPYIVTEANRTFEYKAVFMDEERILGIKDGRNGERLDVLYFG